MTITIPNPPGLPDTSGAGTLEIQMQRRVTHAFIQRLPLNVVLMPRVRTKKPAGGFALTPGSPRPAQVMTLIESSGLAGEPRPTFTLDGVVRVVEFELLGEWDSQMARYDTFVHQGKKFEIIDLFYENGWERRALVSGRG